MANSSLAERFGAIVTFLLLLLYLFTTVLLLNDVYQWFTLPLTEGTINIHTTVGGLVSALVVTQLAITPPGQSPTRRLVADSASERVRQFYTYIVFFYLGAWVFIGVVSLIVGVMLYPESNVTLGNSGTTWLGTAVAAGYSYLQIRPNG
ncbi:MAG: hypothetical protein DYG89_48975 [Caldilinea sp. CFX5]|nr:hypothetical protein [Caldilinea sp. CFX5]